MKTDIIRIDSTGKGMAEAMGEAERLAEHLQADQKETLRIRLLAEEALGMVRAVTGNLEAEFWMESREKKEVKLHIRTEGRLDFDTREELISVSTSGKNESEKGFMRKLIAYAERGIHEIEDVNAEQGSPMIMFGSLGVYEPDIVMSPSAWSLATYRGNLEERVQGEADSAEEEAALDELEKSVVASIADDVKVYIKKGQAEIVIEKDF